MRVRLLGSVDVADGGRPIAVTGLRRKAILAVLGLHAGDVVSAARLIEVVWGDAAATTRLNTVQSHVSYLRGVLGTRSAIVATPPGYRLDLPGEPTDVVVAERLISAGRQARDPAEGAELLRAALALWRDHPLLDVTEVSWLAEQADRLAALRLAARRALLDARLAFGEHEDLLAELRQLAGRHPFDERVQAQLVLALYRAGRQADALGVLREVRGVLAAELGIDPGPALRALEEAVLKQDPALAPPPPVITLRDPPPTPASPTLAPPTLAPPTLAPRHLTTAGPDLLGRADELRELRHLLAAMGTGTAPVALLAGDPGIGKTRLLGEFARWAERAGHPVLWGRAAEFEQDVPFAILRNALADRLAEVGPVGLAAIPAEDRALLHGIVPMPPGADTDPAGGTAVAERYRLYRAMRGLLEVLARPAGLVLILDDLHWADHGSAEFLDHLLRHPPRGRVLVAAAYRPRQLSGRLQRALGRAGQDGVARLVELSPLSFAEAEGLLPARLGEPQRRHLYEASGGNPFYLQALARGEVPRGAAGTAGADDAMPANVRAALAAELDTLSPTEALVAGAVAVAGADAAPDLLARVADLPLTRVLAALDGLVGRDLLRPLPRTDRFQFRHPLVRRVAYDAAGSGWRIGAHARAAAQLRLRGAPVAEQAHHVERSASRGDEAAVDILREAATVNLHSSPAAAAHWLGAALRLVPDDVMSAPVRFALLGLRAQALALSGQLRESRAALHDLLHLVPAEAAEMRAQLVVTCAGIERMLRHNREADGLLLTELARLPDRDGPAAAALLVGLASGQFQGGVPEDGEDWPRVALAAARRFDDRCLLADALVECVFADHGAGNVDGLTDGRLDEASALVDAMPDAEVARRLHVLAWLATAENSHERVDDAVRHTDRALDVAGATGQAYLSGGLHLVRSGSHLLTGELREAAAHLEDAREGAALAGTDGMLSLVLAAQSTVVALLGDLDLAFRLAKEGAAVAGSRRDIFGATAAAALASVHLDTGDPATCTELLAAYHDGSQRQITSPHLRARCYELLARAAAEQGHVARATGWADRAHAEVLAWSSPRRDGLARLARAHALGSTDAAGAAAQARAAAAVFAACGDRLHTGRAHLLAGAALAEADDADAARREFALARALFDVCGAPLLRAQALGAERRLGVPRPRVARRPAASDPTRGTSTP